MRTLRTAIDTAHGFRFLFGGSFATPRRHRGKLARWPEDTSIPEHEIREILDSWATQQNVAWRCARLLAWTSLLRAAWGALRLAY